MYFELLSVYDFDNQRKDDEFQLAFCKVRGFVLVTLDKDFMDDRKYPIQKLPGIVVIAAPKIRDKDRPMPFDFHRVLDICPFSERVLVRLQVPGDGVGKVLRQFGYFD